MGMCMSLSGEEKEQRRLSKEARFAEAKAAQLLAEMPGRMCWNAAARSCSLYSKQGCKGVNQDSMLVWEGFAAEEESLFLGVFDGHGPLGHLVANKVRDCLPSLLTLPLESLLEGYDTPHHHIYKPIKIDTATSTADFTGEKVDLVAHDQGSDGIEERFTAAFHKMDERLKLHPEISCMSSGTTAVAILLQDKDLVVGSVGDSRAILATRCSDGSLVANQLTVELKPDSSGEKERIQKCQGRIFALPDEPHIQRLWLPHANTPGLAMARALGDFCLKEYGLIATPQISHRKISENDEFLILATDGVWDVLTNAEVLETVCLSSQEDAAKAIVDAATGAWKRRNLAHRMDDCTVVCHFLKQKPDASSKFGVSDSSKLKGQEETGDDEKRQEYASHPPERDHPLHRYDTVVVDSDLVDQLNAFKPSVEDQEATKYKTEAYQEAENQPP